MEQGYLTITNEGLIDEKALNLIGVSDKRGNDEKIGYCGSGLKYAIAYLLRNNHDVELYSGKKKISIDTVKGEFRDQEYDIIRINKRETSFTTSMGPDWKLWFAVREIYSNAIDEGNATIEIKDGITPDINKTIFCIRVDDGINEIINNFDSYFATRRKEIHSGYASYHGTVKLYDPIARGKANIYRKGIRCYETNLKSIFDYDFDNIEINESRVIKYSFQLPDALDHYYRHTDNQYIIQQLFEQINNKEYLENSIDWDQNEFSPAWLDAIANRILIPYELSGWYAGEFEMPIHLPGKLILCLQMHFKDKIKTPIGMKKNGVNYREINYNDLHNMNKAIWKAVKDFCKECEYQIPYDVKFVEFSDENVFGSVDNGNVLIGLTAFSRGKFEVLSTLIEEIVHIESKKGDETRSFQDALIRHFVNYMQNRNVYLI